jgi:hypothetical protein
VGGEADDVMVMNEEAQREVKARETLPTRREGETVDD